MIPGQSRHWCAIAVAEQGHVAGLVEVKIFVGEIELVHVSLEEVLAIAGVMWLHSYVAVGGAIAVE